MILKIKSIFLKMSTTSHLTDKLDDANIIKAAIYSAILAKGGTFASGTDLSDYPAAILSIPGGGGDDLSWIKRAQDGELTDLSGYTIPNGLAVLKYGMCYMFKDCSTLTAPPDLSNITSVSEGGMFDMFWNCTSLTTGPDLSGVTSVGDKGMYYMFQNCTGLTTPPDLSNVTSLADWGMSYMFTNCWNLTTTPDLSNITSVGNHAMNAMFDGCSSITSADLSSVTSVGTYGMYNMFINCTSLTELKVGWSTWPTALNALDNWVDGVASTGIFHCPPGLPEIFDNNHIHAGWTVIHDVV